MNYQEILNALSEVTSREAIEFLPLAPDARPLSPYAPIQKYALDLKNGAKPETAAEDLFTALCKDVLGFQPTRQVGSGEGWVDFMLPERMGDPLPLELKPLFQYDKSADNVWRNEANPKNHVGQVKKYLRDHEYLILTDLRTAWFFSARDFFFDDKPFAEMPFVDFFSRCRESRSVLDTLRRAEDTADKPELEQQFFDDLNIWFNEFDKVKWTPADQAAESIILLINKLVFARTIEDFGLVPYRYTQDAYARHTRDWQAKGAHRIVPKFLDQFEEFFDEYYDTEIFSARIWERLDKDPANLQRFCDKLNFVLGINTWDQVFSRGIVHYNYRRIDEDIFGKSYEMFLAANRKGEGIYYTPAPITGPMANAIVNSLAAKIVDEICDAVGSQKCDFARADKLLAQLAEIRVADTACGSGGFLIKVLRSFWQQYQRIDAACAWVAKILKPDNGELYLAELPPNVESALAFRRRNNLDNRRVLIAQILLRHIYGVDKDSGALEVAKTNIWKEAVKLSPADYNYRELKTDVVKILPNLELNFHCADSLVDVELEKQTTWLADYHKAELKKLSELRDRYIANPMLHEPLEEALALRDKIRADFVEHFQGENLPCEPAGFTLHFWPCWFAPDGKARKISGFDGIIGNPPWENVKPVAKEFAKIGKLSLDRADFDKWFSGKLKEDKALAERWREHQEWFDRYKEYLGRRFFKQGTGDWNLWKLFIEGDLNLIRDGGRLSLLVPSGLQTDEGCADLRRWVTHENTFEELTSFENRGYDEIVNGKERTKHIFPDVDSRYKFGFFKVIKGEKPSDQHVFAARFYLHDPKDIFAPPIHYSVEMVRRFSPENFGIMEFRSERDYELCVKIRGKHSLLKDLGHPFRREFHITEDAHFFHKAEGKKASAGQMPLFEGKMIHQFDNHFTPANYYVLEKEAREELLRKEIFRLAQIVRETDVKTIEGEKVPAGKEDLANFLNKLFKRKKFKLHYEAPRLVYRKIGSSTNERTLISAIVDRETCLGESLNYLTPFDYEIDKKGKLDQIPVPQETIYAVVCLLNSLVLNFYIRSKISANVNLFYLYEMPIPKLSGVQKKKLADFAGKLLKNPREVKERATLETFIARELYGLSLEDWKHLTGTFTFGSGETKAELDEIIRQSIALWEMK
ncbi:MAG TPA: hypothetical protein VGI03_10410 [Verrucomicrobiae bacterium]